MDDLVTLLTICMSTAHFATSIPSNQNKKAKTPSNTSASANQSGRPWLKAQKKQLACLLKILDGVSVYFCLLYHLIHSLHDSTCDSSNNNSNNTNSSNNNGSNTNSGNTSNSNTINNNTNSNNTSNSNTNSNNTNDSTMKDKLSKILQTKSWLLELLVGMAYEPGLTCLHPVSQSQAFLLLSAMAKSSDVCHQSLCQMTFAIEQQHAQSNASHDRQSNPSSNVQSNQKDSNATQVKAEQLSLLNHTVNIILMNTDNADVSMHIPSDDILSHQFSDGSYSLHESSLIVAMSALSLFSSLYEGKHDARLAFISTLAPSPDEQQQAMANTLLSAIFDVLSLHSVPTTNNSSNSATDSSVPMASDQLMRVKGCMLWSARMCSNRVFCCQRSWLAAAAMARVVGLDRWSGDIAMRTALSLIHSASGSVEDVPEELHTSDNRSDNSSSSRTSSSSSDISNGNSITNTAVTNSTFPSTVSQRNRLVLLDNLIMAISMTLSNNNNNNTNDALTVSCIGPMELSPLWSLLITLLFAKDSSPMGCNPNDTITDTNSTSPLLLYLLEQDTNNSTITHLIQTILTALNTKTSSYKQNILSIGISIHTDIHLYILCSMLCHQLICYYHSHRQSTNNTSLLTSVIQQLLNALFKNNNHSTGLYDLLSQLNQLYKYSLSIGLDCMNGRDSYDDAMYQLIQMNLNAMMIASNSSSNRSNRSNDGLLMDLDVHLSLFSSVGDSSNAMTSYQRNSSVVVPLIDPLVLAMFVRDYHSIIDILHDKPYFLVDNVKESKEKAKDSNVLELKELREQLRKAQQVNTQLLGRIDELEGEQTGYLEMIGLLEHQLKQRWNVVNAMNNTMDVQSHGIDGVDAQSLGIDAQSLGVDAQSLGIDGVDAQSLGIDGVNEMSPVGLSLQSLLPSSESNQLVSPYSANTMTNITNNLQPIHESFHYSSYDSMVQFNNQSMPTQPKYYAASTIINSDMNAEQVITMPSYPATNQDDSTGINSVNGTHITMNSNSSNALPSTASSTTLTDNQSNSLTDRPSTPNSFILSL